MTVEKQKRNTSAHDGQNLTKHQYENRQSLSYLLSRRDWVNLSALSTSDIRHAAASLSLPASKAPRLAAQSPSRKIITLTENTMETPPTAIMPRKDLRSLLNSDQVKAEIGRALPEHLTPDRFIRVMLTTLTRTPKLADCSRESVMRCLMDCSALGIEPDGRRAHLIPYGKECQLILDYKGLIELARRSGDIASIRAELVCEADEFAWRNGDITHEVNWRAPRGDVQAVYAIATLRSGETQSAVLTRDEVEGIRKRSKAGNSGPWVTDFGEMAKKTAVRRLCKMLPLSVELAEAMDRDDDRISERNVTPVKLSLPTSDVLDVAEAKSEVEYTEGGDQ